jgi:hypothetical protein
MISSCCRRWAGVALMLLGLPAVAAAQALPSPGASGNPVCVRLEGQLAAIDRAGADPARAEQARRIDESLSKQQGDLDRVQAQYQRLGCQPVTLFSIFVTQAPQCGALGGQIQQMRGTIDRTLADLQRTRRGGDDDMQRQAVIGALAQNNCGPQYRAAVPQQRGFFETLFGGPNTNIPPPAPGDYPQVGAGGYRTLCVRTCDGYYFPISNSTSSTRFGDDEQTCQKLCPIPIAIPARTWPRRSRITAASTRTCPTPSGTGANSTRPAAAACPARAGPTRWGRSRIPRWSAAISW